MTYTAFILHVRDDERSRARLEAGVQLAKRFDAAVIGVGAESFPAAYVSPEAAFIEGPLLAEHRGTIENGLKKAKSIFDQSTAGRITKSEWRASIDFPAEVVAREARAADLVLASAEDPGEDAYRDASAADLLMNAGRPVLVVPAEAPPFEGRSVLIGWKDTREARRAVADAMPLLQAADSVAVVEVYREGAHEAPFARASDIARALGRHGVKAHPHARPCRDDPGADLLRIAQEHESDLVVAGGYGHSRLQEWIFGGVTKTLLRRADRYVLVSH